MAIQSGSDLLLKIGDGGDPESFATIGGLRTTFLRVENQTVANDNVASGAWRSLLEGGGTKQITVSASGWFSDSAEEETLRAHAFANGAANYELHFGNGDTLSGPFQLTRYQRDGSRGEAEEYSITLVSAGVVSYSAT